MNNIMDLAFTSQIQLYNAGNHIFFLFPFFFCFLLILIKEVNYITICINFSPFSLKHLSYANSPKSSVD